MGYIVSLAMTQKTRRNVLRDIGVGAAGFSVLNAGVAAADSHTNFDQAKQETSTLAGRVDTVSQSIPQNTRVQSTLDDLTNSVNSGSLQAGTATEAVNRMKIAMNVTERTIVAWGPSSRITPENSNTLVGSSGTTEYNLAGRMADFAINAFLEVALVSASFADVGGTAASRVSSKIDEASKMTSRVKNFIVDTFLSTFDEAISLIKRRSPGTVDEIKAFIDATSTTAGREILKKIGNSTADLKSRVVDVLVTSFERSSSVSTSVNEALIEMDNTLGGDDPELPGTLSGARNASNQGITKIENILSSTTDDLDTLETALNLVPVLSALAAVLLASTIFSTVGAILTLAADVASIVGSSFGIVAVQGVVSGLTLSHNQAVSGVLDGGV